MKVVALPPIFGLKSTLFWAMSGMTGAKEKQQEENEVSEYNIVCSGQKTSFSEQKKSSGRSFWSKASFHEA